MGRNDGESSGSWLFGKVTLNLLMAAFFFAACVTSVVLTNQNYSTDASQDWMLVGGLTSNSATFRVRLRDGPTSERFVVSTAPLLNENSTGIVLEEELVVRDDSTLVQSVTVESLESDTEYYYGTLSGEDGQEVLMRQGRFRTAPPTGERSSFKFAAAGCAMTGSEHRIFSEIEDEDVLFFMHLGDFHYLDINDEDVEVRINGIDKTLGSASQASLFANTPMSVMWDDHDWLGNDSLGYDKGRQAALDSYQQAFPFHAPLPSNNSMYHAFTIGTVRFVISDLRSERTEESMYSDEQREWLFNEIAQAEQYDFVIWVTTVPWIGEPEPGADNWMGQPADRRDLSNWISTVLASKQNLLALSADAHMVGFDDGSHTYYGNETTVYNGNETGTPLSFPILHSGPMDRLGSVKGGPYSGGCTTYKYERNSMYSVVEFNGDDGDQPCLEIKSYRVLPGLEGSAGKEEVFSAKLCGQMFSSSQDATEGDCDAEWFSKTNKSLIASASCILFLVYIQSCLVGNSICDAFLISASVTIWFGLSLVAAFFIPKAQGYDQFDTFAIAVIGLTQTATATVYLLAWGCFG